MTTKKKYIVVKLHPLSIDIMGKGGVLKTFDFLGGFTHPVFKPGSYITSNEEEQKMLEAHPWFNKEFVLERIIETEKEEGQQGNSGGSNTVEKTFKTVNFAKDYFHNEHGIAKSKLDVKSKIIAEGKLLNIDVKFESDNN